MKKIWMIVLLCFVLSSCGMNTAVPAFSDTNDLASELYIRSGLKTNNVYSEEVEDSLAFAFGISAEEFNEFVDSAVCYRQTVDSSGQTLYVFEMESEKDAAWFADKAYRCYDWAPCDVSEKISIASAGKYVILFKSSAKEVDKVLETFRTLSGGSLRFHKDLYNPG